MPEQLGRVSGAHDEESPGPIPDVPEPTSAEIDFLLDTVNAGLGTALGRADVRGSYAGLRLLIDTARGRTADVSRDHAGDRIRLRNVQRRAESSPEYRAMAEDGWTARWPRGISGSARRTRNLPLVGAPANPAPICGSQVITQLAGGPLRRGRRRA